jgi:hypothetical protein
MKFEDLKLTYGYPLQLQVNNSAGQPERFSCRLIGCMPGRSILLSVPRASGKLLRFRAGQKMVVRMMVDNGIGLFASVVETQTAEPYPILHVNYPEQVSFKGIRGATRVNVDLPIQVKNLSVINEEVMKGTIADISISGARMELLEPVGEIGDKIRISARVTILNMVRELMVDAIIRSRLERSTQEADKNLPAVYGVEFTEEDEEKRLLLCAYVFGQIVDEQQLTPA